MASDFPQIYADAIRIQHVMRNLINNALRFTPPGGNVVIAARVNNTLIETTSTDSVTTRGEKQQVEVNIRDSGYGIAPEYQERIFERFY